MQPNVRAVFQILLTTLIWGFGFVATKWAIGGLPPLWLTAVRFALAAACVVPFQLALPAFRRHASLDQLRLAAVPGCLLGACLLLQTLGLKYTTVANSSFVTTLYVVLVPLLAAAFQRRNVPLGHWALVGVALVGTALICQLQTLTINVGDALTFLCAVAAAWHMLVLEARGGRIRSAFHFNVYQSLWAALISTIAAVIFEGSPVPVATWNAPALIGLAFLAIPCTLIGFALQVQAQRVLPAAVASLLFLLESPFASAFGYAVLGERLEPSQLVGAVLILVAAAGATAYAARSQRAVAPVAVAVSTH